MLKTQIEDGSALVTKATRVKESGFLQPAEGASKQADPSKPFNRDSHFCTFCKKHRHTKEQCWKLNGRPPMNNRNTRDKGQAYMASIHPNNEGNSQSFVSKFKKEEIDKLKNLLESFEKPSSASTCSLVFSDISSSSCVTNVSEKISSTMWVIEKW